jgi:ADP-ribosylglycohydrolase
MLASAAGDALGAPVEFLGIEQIVDAFGPRGIQDLVPAYGRLGAVTDDTQMAIATARGLVKAMRTGSDEVDAVLEAYFAWLDSLRDPANVRGPGSTCVGGLEEQLKARTACAENDSKGCGGVMRVHPVGLYVPGDPEAAYELGRRTADLTHGHPTSGVSSGVQAALVSQLVVGVSVLEAIGTLLEMLGDRDENLETLAAVQKALDLGMQGAPGREALSAIGEGWIAEEALAAGVYVLARYADAPLDGLAAAVNHSGDSDSTGAIAGALLGALRGGEWLPEKWLEVLEHREVLEELAGELAGLDP